MPFFINKFIINLLTFYKKIVKYMKFAEKTNTREIKINKRNN